MSTDDADSTPAAELPQFDFSGGELAPTQPAFEIGIKQRREGIRGRLALSLVWILAGTVILGFVGLALDWATADEMKDFLAILLTPIVGLVGAATGFYFGGGGDAGAPDS